MAEDVAEELRFHFESRIDDLTKQGVSLVDARAQAIAEFGDVDSVSDSLREIHQRIERRRGRVEWVHGIAQDAVYSLRSLRRSPGLVASVLATLGLGLGVNAVMFSFLDTVFLRPPAGVATPDRIDRVWAEHQFKDGVQFWAGFSYPQYVGIANALSGRAQTAIYKPGQPTNVEILGHSVPELRLAYAEPSYFRILGVHQSRGRLYSSVEDNLESPNAVAVIGQRVSERVFGTESSALGKRVTIGPRTFTIIGILPSAFAGVDLDAVDIWLPFSAQPAPPNDPTWWRQGYRNSFQILVTVPSGSSQE
ncbi:MAG: ABC transporter permease, partial [bacterium]